MSGVQQATFMNQRSFGLIIGQAYEGGFFAGQISTTANGVATHNLVIGPLSTAQNLSKQWKTSNTSTAGTTSVIDGPTNSSNMNNASHPAAQFCEGLSIGGFSDWYMPAQNELEVCYYNLKPSTGINSANVTNVNAVPARTSIYTSSIPSQTSAAAFQTGGTEAFTTTYYWSSTEASATNAIFKRFIYGQQAGYSKISSYPRVRAIRRVAV